MHLMGLMSLQAGQYDHAVQWLSRAIRQTPSTNYLSTLGIALKQMGRLDDALLSFQHVLKLDPRHFEAAYQRGVLLHRLERFEEALVQLNLCDEMRPDHAPTLQTRARVLRALKRYEECLASLMCPPSRSAFPSRRKPIRPSTCTVRS